MIRSERGSAVVTAMLAALVLGVLATSMMRSSFSDLGQTQRTVASNQSLQAAEAGVDDYIAKLTEDHAYYDHFVHPGESTRRSTSGTLRAAGAAWDGGTTWTYPSGRNAWRSAGDGVEYNLRIDPPSSARPSVRILATGRIAGDDATAKSVETLVRPASIADFQMIANRDITYGSAATTYGKLYAGIDENGTAHSVRHDGTAHADIYAEQSVTGSPTYRDGARAYNRSTIRRVIRNPINFNTFTGSLVDVQRAATGGGIVLDNPSYDAWQLTFNTAGTVTIRGCTRARSGRTTQELGAATPSCPGSTTTVRTVPTNGAIYVRQSAIVLGTVHGRATVATAGDVVVGGNLAYDRPGTDVLGLVAEDDVLVPAWAPTTLNWSAASIAITGQWHSYLNSGPGGSTMTFNGSAATNLGGYMSQFAVRNYVYDRNLLFLQPPYFPVLEEAYTVELFREVPVT